MFTDETSASSTSVFARTWVLAATFAFVGFLIPTIYGFIFGFPVAHVQDELSYTVAADTYAHGRLTNPTPVFWESVETPHVIMEPSYISKYPPLQGMFMALGQVVFGNQIFGVWISCGVFAGALFWMMTAWTRREWAIAMTAAMILLVGLNSYWAQSYWGGMIAASGGALFFGAFRRLLDKFTAGSTILMTIGGVMLVNSRPFEGTVSMVPALVYLLYRLIRDADNSWKQKFTRVILPGAVVAGIAVSAMCYQFYRVTGSPFKMPYSVHHAQYYPAPLFSFQNPNPNATKGNARIRKMYDNYVIPPILESMLELGLPDSTVLRSVYGFIYLNYGLPFFIFSPMLLILFYFSVPLVVRADWKYRILLASMLFTFLCVAIGVWWDQFHYVAPLTAVMVLFVAEAFRRIQDAAKNSQERFKVLAAFVVLVVGSFVYQQLYSYKQPQLVKDFTPSRAALIDGLANNSAVRIEIPYRATFFKDEMEKIVADRPGEFLAIVTYDKDFSFHDEIVYNKADIEGSKMIWAHDLGEAKNAALLEHFPNRKIIHVNISSNYIDVAPFSSN